MKIIDQNVIEGLKEIGDDEFLHELIDLFLPQAEQLVKEIQNSFTEKDNDKMIKAAHKLKGSCLNLGAERLGHLCQAIEALARENKIAETNDYIIQVPDIYLQTHQELSKFR